jgi:hypothetical protein
VQDIAGKDSKITLFDALQDHLCRMLVYFVSFLASRIGFERPASFADLMQQVATRSHGWRENGALFAAAGLEKHGVNLFRPLNMGLKAGVHPVPQSVQYNKPGADLTP